MQAALYPGKPIYGGSAQGSADHIVKDKDEVTISEQLSVKYVITPFLITTLSPIDSDSTPSDCTYRCLATPCHTQDSICYYVTDKSNSAQPGAVFTGDTLFIGGCGRFFEGTAAEMHRSLSYLATLPDPTIVYNGHEYTKSNHAFAKAIEPNAPGVKRLQELVDKNEVTTGKSTIGDEKEWNVFMRLDSQEVR